MVVVCRGGAPGRARKKANQHKGEEKTFITEAEESHEAAHKHEDEEDEEKVAASVESSSSEEEEEEDDDVCQQFSHIFFLTLFSQGS